MAEFIAHAAPELKIENVLIVDEASASDVSNTSVGATKSRSNSLGKLFQKMRSSEVVSKLRKGPGPGAAGEHQPTATDATTDSADALPRKTSSNVCRMLPNYT